MRTEDDYKRLEAIIELLISDKSRYFEVEDITMRKLVDSKTQGELYFGVLKNKKYNDYKIVDQNEEKGTIKYNYNLREFHKAGGFRKTDQDAITEKERPFIYQFWNLILLGILIIVTATVSFFQQCSQDEKTQESKEQPVQPLLEKHKSFYTTPTK